MGEAESSTPSRDDQTNVDQTSAVVNRCHMEVAERCRFGTSVLDSSVSVGFNGTVTGWASITDAASAQPWLQRFIDDLVLVRDDWAQGHHRARNQRRRELRTTLAEREATVEALLSLTTWR
jgi:hypothetical protein